MWILISRLLVASNEAPNMGTSQWRGCLFWKPLARRQPASAAANAGSPSLSCVLPAVCQAWGWWQTPWWTPAPAAELASTCCHPPKLFCPLLGPWICSAPQLGSHGSFGWTKLHIVYVCRKRTASDKHVRTLARQTPNYSSVLFFLIKRKKNQTKTSCTKQGQCGWSAFFLWLT